MARWLERPACNGKVPGSIPGLAFLFSSYNVLPGTVLTTESMSVTFCKVGALDLWSGDCVELASALLQQGPHVWELQLGLIAALYIDSTKQAGPPSTAFADLLKITSVPETRMSTWWSVATYNQTKLAGYWYMALFQEPIYKQFSENSPVQDIAYVIL